MEARLYAIVLVESLAGCSDAVVQPIPFSHQLHMADEAAACDSCHEQVLDQAYAGLPRVRTCMECHSSDVTNRPEAVPLVAILRKHAKARAEIPWVRLYELPSHVYFSHRRHAKIAGLDCALCHGDIGHSPEPPDRPIAATLEMSTCIACHESRGASTDCAACHR